MTPTEALFRLEIKMFFLHVFTDFTVIAVEQRPQENTDVFLKTFMKSKKGQYFFRKQNFCLEVTKTALKHWHIG